MRHTAAARFGIGMSIGFGLLIAILSILHVGALGTVAAIGGIALGGMWVFITLFTRRNEPPHSAP